MVLHNNYDYWWAEDNKKSTRYTFIEREIKKCSGSLAITGDKVIKSTGHCRHTCPQVSTDVVAAEFASIREQSSINTWPKRFEYSNK